MYGPEHYVQFTDIWTDSLEYSFFFYSWANDLQIPLAVKLVGDPLKEKTKFVIKVVEDETTAKPSQYGLPEEIYFKPEPNGRYALSDVEKSGFNPESQTRR